MGQNFFYFTKFSDLLQMLKLPKDQPLGEKKINVIINEKMTCG